MRVTDLSCWEVGYEKGAKKGVGNIYIGVHTEIRVPKFPANPFEGRGNIEQSISVGVPRTPGS